MNTKNEQVAQAILSFLQEHDLFFDVRIYVNGKAFDSREGIIDDIWPSDFFDSANDDSVSMSFEGPFYRVMNESDPEYKTIARNFLRMLESHGFYYELGNTWNLTLFEL